MHTNFDDLTHDKIQVEIDKLMTKTAELIKVIRKYALVFVLSITALAIFAGSNFIQ